MLLSVRAGKFAGFSALVGKLLLFEEIIDPPRGRRRHLQAVHRLGELAHGALKKIDVDEERGYRAVRDNPALVHQEAADDAHRRIGEIGNEIHQGLHDA